VGCHYLLVQSVNNASNIWSGTKKHIWHASAEGNLTGFNIFSIFIGVVRENEKLREQLVETKQRVDELESEIFIFFLSKTKGVLALFIIRINSVLLFLL